MLGIEEVGQIYILWNKIPSNEMVSFVSRHCWRSSVVNVQDNASLDSSYFFDDESTGTPKKLLKISVIIEQA